MLHTDAAAVWRRYRHEQEIQHHRRGRGRTWTTQTTKENEPPPCVYISPPPCPYPQQNRQTESLNTRKPPPALESSPPAAVLLAYAVRLSCVSPHCKPPPLSFIRGKRPKASTTRPPYGRSSPAQMIDSKKRGRGRVFCPAVCVVSTPGKARNRRAACLIVWTRFGRIRKVLIFCL